MASLQIGAGIGPIKVGAGVSLQLSDLEIQVLVGAEKEAREFVAKNDNEAAQQRQHATVSGSMKNSLSRNLKLAKEPHNYHGHFVCPPPPTLVGANGSGPFVHRATPEQSYPPVTVASKAAVVYATNDNDCTQLGYILAFYKSQCNPNDIKVYVEAGKLSEIMKQDFSDIEKKLDASGSKSKFKDPKTGAEACAEIKNEGCNNLAVLGACFNRTCPA